MKAAVIHITNRGSVYDNSMYDGAFTAATSLRRSCEWRQPALIALVFFKPSLRYRLHLFLCSLTKETERVKKHQKVWNREKKITRTSKNWAGVRFGYRGVSMAMIILKEAIDADEHLSVVIFWIQRISSWGGKQQVDIFGLATLLEGVNNQVFKVFFKNLRDKITFWYYVVLSFDIRSKHVRSCRLWLD